MVIDNNKQCVFSGMDQSNVSRSLDHENPVLGGFGVQILTLNIWNFKP